MSRETLREQVEAYVSEHRLSIAHPLQRYNASSQYSNLPRHAKMHWRGLLQPKAGIVSGMFQVDERLLPSVTPKSRKTEFVPHEAAVLCHCKPLDDRYKVVGSENRFPDVPDRWDIYLLMRHQYDAFAFAGERLAAIIRRTERTYRTILKLRDWESDANGGMYRRSRVKSQLRSRLGREPLFHEIERAHAKTALTYLGYQLPGKPNERRRAWPDLLRELGFEVEITEEIEPTKHTGMSHKMMQAYRERYPERRD